MSPALSPSTAPPTWCDPEKWKEPRWPHSKPRTYEDYVARQLRIRYSELEGSLRTGIELKSQKDRTTADRVYDYLQRARALLERDRPSIIEAAAYLNLADRYIVWLYPSECLRPETIKVLARLEERKPVGWEQFKKEIEKCRPVGDGAFDEHYLDQRKAALDQAIAAINEALVEDRISSLLQIRCLGHLIIGGLGLLIAMCLAAPVAVSGDAIQNLPTGMSWLHPFGIDSLLVAMVVALIGGLGGFLSALMDARRMKMTIDIYQERLRLLEIKPLVGALASIVLFYLLSWKVLPAVAPQNLGTYLLVSLLAGFSEKYFLRLLPLDPGNPRTDRVPSRGTLGDVQSRSTDPPSEETAPQTVVVPPAA